MRKLTALENAKIRAFGFDPLIERLVAQEWAKVPEVKEDKEDKVLNWLMIVLTAISLVTLAVVAFTPSLSLPRLTGNVIFWIWLSEIMLPSLICGRMIQMMKKDYHVIWSPFFLQLWKDKGLIAWMWEKTVGLLLAALLAMNGYIVTAAIVLMVWIVVQTTIYVVKMMIENSIERVEKATPIERKFIEFAWF